MFSFWSPIDTLFIKTMMNLANQSKIEYVSFFWPTVMFDYLTYNAATHANMSASEKLRTGQQAGFQKMLRKQLSPTGAFLQKQLALATAVAEQHTQRIEEFEMAQNYPNPFSANGAFGNPATVISFQLSVNSYVTVKVFDVNGREVARLIDGEMNAGNHHVTFAPRDWAGGIYFYQLTAGKFSQTRKAILMK